MVKKLLVEASQTGLVKTTGNRWLVVLAAPGKGSSGNYSAAILREQGPAAFAKGAKCFITHDPARNPKDMLGTYPDGAWYSDDFDLENYPEGALVSELSVFSHHKQFVEEVGPEAALSIYMDGDTDDNGDVVAIYPGPTNGADLVSYGGLTGSGLREKLYESARDSGFTPDGKPSGEPSAQDKKKKGSMDQELKDALKALIKESLDAFALELKSEAVAKATEAADEEAVAKAVDEALEGYEEKLVAIEAAELLPSQVESIKAVARKGGDVMPLIESAKKIVSEAKKLTESYVDARGVRINESGKSFDFGVDRWKGDSE